MKAAKEGTKDGLEKTKAAVKKGRSFIKTKSFCHGMYTLNGHMPLIRSFSSCTQFPLGVRSVCLFICWIIVFVSFTMLSFLNVLERKSACCEDEESELFIEVDCFNVEPVLCPAPEGLSQQQVINIPSKIISIDVR